MRCALGFAQARLEGRRPGSSGYRRERRRRGHFLHETEPRLAAAGEFRIDFRQQFRVEQRTVFGAAAVVDAVTDAKIVELVGTAGTTAARKGQRVYGTLAAEDRLLAALELGIEEGKVETRIVNDELGVAEKGDELFDDFGEQRLVGEELLRQAVNRLGFGGHVAFGIDVDVIGLTARDAVDQLDAA